MSRATDIARRQTQQANDTLKHALETILDTSEGRELYRWISANSHVFAPAPQDGTERWLGWRDLGLFLVSTMRAANLRGCLLAEEEGAHDEVARRAAFDAALKADEREARENTPFPQNSTTQD